MFSTVLSVSVFTAFLCCLSNAANVAVINSYISHSHFAFSVKLADILADEGHNVTMIVTELDTSHFAPLPKKAKTIIRSNFSTNPNLRGNQEQNFWNDGYEIFQTNSMMIAFLAQLHNQCERFLGDTAFVERIKAEHFDIAMIEPMDFCGYGFLKMIGLKNYVNVSPMAISETIAHQLGLPGRSYEPYPASYDYYFPMPYFERVSNYALSMMRYFYHGFNDGSMAIAAVRKYVDPEFTKNEAVGNARFNFFNTEEHMDFPRPISHKVVYIGGITLTESSPEALPEDYKKIFDESQKGVVMVSFGTIAKSDSMVDRKKQAFLNMFAAFPEINFIWKYENASDPIANDLPNVFKKEWVPQPQILAHPKLLAFVTHGGMNSVLESAHAGVPVLGIPLFGDQVRNIKMLEYRKIAVLVDKNDISSELLIDAIHRLIDDDSYKKRAQTIAALARTKPMSGKQRFISHFNHAVQFVHADDHLDIGHRSVGTFWYYNLDIYGTFAVIGIAFVVMLLKMILFVLSKLSCTVNRKISELKKSE